MSDTYRRRDILRMAAAGPLALAASAASAQSSADKPLRIGFVGVGGRGTGLLRNLLRIDGVEIPALCDINESNLARAQKLVEEASRGKPAGYSKSATDFRRLVERDDIDLVINATPWQWHTPIAVAAMEAGKHAATEVPAAQTVEECWQLVETAEKTGKQCALLENVNYGRAELFILNMVRAGVLGELLFVEGGYMHDLRSVKFNTVRHGEPWRLEPSRTRDGNLYPTHPLGPIAWWMNINRGDRFSFLVSMSTKARSLKRYALKQFGPDDYRAKQDYKLGDVNTTLIRTEMGRTINLYHDTNTPRPYERYTRLQGTKGVYSGMLNKIYIEGRSPEKDRWEPLDEYKKQYGHKLWRKLEEDARGGGHGGMDYMELYRLVKNLRAGKPLDIDVYDAAAWSAIVPLSEASVAGRGKSMDVPDFTRGKWKIRPPIDPDTII